MFHIGNGGIHGLGWFATVDIPANTTIFDEEVTIRLPLDLQKCSLDTGTLEEQVARMPKDQREALLALFGKDLHENVWMNCTPLIDFTSDPLGLGARKEIGIYLKSARLNHSCIPNAVRASDKGNIMSVVSQKNIAAGEEITVSYLDDNFAVRDDRERELSTKIQVGRYWEKCLCTLCNGTESVRIASDIRRRKLFAYRRELLQGRLNPMVMMLEFLPLIQEEGLSISAMGPEANVEFCRMALGGSGGLAAISDCADGTNFPCVGSKVVLHKLKAKPELNGQNGTVVYPLNKATGRVGVVLDSSESRKKPIAVKPENLLARK